MVTVVISKFVLLPDMSFLYHVLRGVSRDFGGVDGVGPLSLHNLLKPLPKIAVGHESPRLGRPPIRRSQYFPGVPDHSGVVDANMYGSWAEAGHDEPSDLHSCGRIPKVVNSGLCVVVVVVVANELLLLCVEVVMWVGEPRSAPPCLPVV